MEVARGEIDIQLNDRAALSGLRRTEAEFKRSMNRIDREEAMARIGADIDPLKQKLREAKARLKEFEKSDAATAKANIANQKRKVAGIQDELNARRDALAAQRAQNKAEEIAEKRAVQLIKRRDDLTKAENSAYRENEKRSKAAVDNSVKEEAHALKLQQRLIKLTQTEAKLAREQGRPRHAVASPAVKQKVQVDRASALAEMAVLRAELEAMSHPAVHIDVELDTDSSILSRWLKTLTETTVRIGPFTTSIKGLGAALALLGPIIVALVGTTGALTAALGSGLMGAVGIGTAGLLGFGLAALGVGGILAPLVGQLGGVFAAQKKYNDQVDKYGEASDEAAKAQEKLSKLMGDVPPKTLAAFKSVEGLRSQWRGLTKDARPKFFESVGEAIETAGALMPTFANRSMQAFSSVSQGFNKWMRGMRSPEAKGILDNVMAGFNAAIPSLMDGLGNLGTYIGRIGQSFSRWLAPLAEGFKAWSAGLASSAADAGSLNTRVDSLVNSMRAVGHVFAAAGRVVLAFFKGGQSSGTDMLERWATSLNNLATRMNSVAGQRSMDNFFKRSIDLARQFWQTIKPLIQLFYEWTTIMRPFTQIGLQLAQALSGIVQAVSAFGPVKGMLQAAFGIFLVGALAGRIREISAAMKGLAVTMAASRIGQTVGSGFTMIPASANKATMATNSTTKAMKGAATQAAVTGAAMGTFAGSASKASTNTQNIGATAQKTGRGLGMLKAGGMAASAGMAALGGPVGLAVIGGLVAFTMHANRSAQASQRVADAMQRLSQVQGPLAASFRQVQQGLNDVTPAGRKAIGNLEASNNAFQALRQGSMQLVSSHMAVSQSALTVSSAQKEVNRLSKDGKKNSMEYKQALLNLRGAQQQQVQAQQQYIDMSVQTAAAAEKHVNSTKALRDAAKNERDNVKEGTAAWDAYNQKLTQRQEAYQRALNRSTAATINQQRAISDLAAYAPVAEQAVGRFARTFGQIKGAKKFVLQADDTQAGERIANLSNRLNAVGRKKNVVKILADSGSAEEAIRRLRAMVIKDKKVDIKANPGQAISAIAKVAGLRINTKTATVIGNIIDAMSKFGAVNATRLAGKLVNVAGNTNPFWGAIAGIASVVKTVFINVVKRGAKIEGSPAGFASGGEANPRIKQQDRVIQRASERAELKRAQRTRGGEYNRPTFLIGEEDRSEWVIATNPAYRRANERYLAGAAADLGYVVMPAAKKGKKPKKSKKKKGGGDSLYRLGAISLDDMQASVDTAQKRVDNHNNKKPDKSKKNANKIKKWKRAHSPLVSALKKEQSRLKTVKSWQNSIANLETDIDTQQNYMNTADSTGNVKMFGNAKRARGNLLNSLIGKRQGAYNYLKGIGKHNSTWGKALINAISGSQNERVSNSQTQMTAPEAGPTLAEEREAQLESNLARAELTATLTDDAKSLNDLIGFHRAQRKAYEVYLKRAGLSRAQKIGAYEKISSHGSSEKQYMDQLMGQQQSAAAETTVSNQERYNLLKEFGGNMASRSPAPIGSSPAPQTGGGSTLFRTGSDMSVGSGSGAVTVSNQPAGASTSQKNVNIVNNFQASPDDPHTWTKGQAWEAQHAF